MCSLAMRLRLRVSHQGGYQRDRTQHEKELLSQQCTLHCIGAMPTLTAQRGYIRQKHKAKA